MATEGADAMATQAVTATAMRGWAPQLKRQKQLLMMTFAIL